MRITNGKVRAKIFRDSVASLRSSGEIFKSWTMEFENKTVIRETVVLTINKNTVAVEKTPEKSLFSAWRLATP